QPSTPISTLFPYTTLFRSYNYGYSVDVNGNKLPGNWKGIYLYYYDTITPNKTPWEMLGFDIKPEWWDVTYGTDYSSNNTAMWGEDRKSTRLNSSHVKISYA